MDDRDALRGIVYVLLKGVSWRDVPAAQIGCSGVRAWRRLRDWTYAGVWPCLHEVLLAELRRAGLLVMDDAAIDSSHVRALKGGRTPGRHRSTVPAPGSKHHIIVDRYGTPLAVSLTSGNRRDVTQLVPLPDAIPHLRDLRGRPRHRPRRLSAGRGYGFDKYRRLIRARGITPKTARRGTPHGSGLGRTRWAAERTLAWLHQFKRLRIRDEIHGTPHLALLQLACSIICMRRLRTSL